MIILLFLLFILYTIYLNLKLVYRLNVDSLNPYFLGTILSILVNKACNDYIKRFDYMYTIKYRS